jgi:hypothetical protein
LSRLRPALIDAPMYVLYCCVGSPLAGVGLHPRTNDYGQQLCEKCGERLNRVKHHRAYGPGRACHPRCQSQRRAADDTAPVPTAAARSHKRASTNPGKQQTAPAVLIAQPPPPASPRPSFRTHGSSLRSSSRSSRATAASWLELGRDGELNR